MSYDLPDDWFIEETGESLILDYGFNASSVKDWEQGRATPTGPVRAYLKVIEKEPEAVKRALAVA